MEERKGYHCPVEATLDLIGGKYKTLILWHLAGGPQRFSQLQRLISRATPKMLTQQLRELEEDGVIHREVFPVVPPRVEYSLTARGRSLLPILNAMLDKTPMGRTHELQRQPMGDAPARGLRTPAGGDSGWPPGGRGRPGGEE